MGFIYEVGDIVTLKKGHPCGSKEWEILRVGADFRLKCMGCGHMIMVPRKMVEKNPTNLKKKENSKYTFIDINYVVKVKVKYLNIRKAYWQRKSKA